jgi:glycosyltransferase involved in cell wall biosynthesis
MRVGIAAMSSAPGRFGGTAVYTRQLVEALAEYGTGCHFVVIVNANAAATWTVQEWPGHVSFAVVQDELPRQRLATRAVGRVRRALGLATPSPREVLLAGQIDALGLDLIHFPQTIIDPVSIRTPSVLTFFDLQHEYYPEYFAKSVLEWRKRIYRLSVEKAQAVMAPSNYTRDTIIAKYGIAGTKISRVPVGLGKGFRRASSQEIELVRAKYGLPNEFIFYPANPWPHKNHARLMTGMKLYREAFGETPHLALSGRLPAESLDAISLATAAGVEDLVVDLGFVPMEDLPSIYSAARIMAFPSLFEGFGIPLIEAMSCGCPIAAANCTSIPEVTNGAALLFDPLDPRAIADAINRLLHDRTLRDELVKRGYAQRDRFDWATIVPQIMAVYEQIASYGGSGRAGEGLYADALDASKEGVR